MVIILQHSTADTTTLASLSKAVAQSGHTIKVVEDNSGTVSMTNEELLGTLKTLSLQLENPITVEQEIAKMQEENRKQRERSQPHRFKHKKHNYFG